VPFFDFGTFNDLSALGSVVVRGASITYVLSMNRVHLSLLFLSTTWRPSIHDSWMLPCYSLPFVPLNDLGIFGSSFNFVTFGFLSISLISQSLLVLSIGLVWLLQLHTEVRFGVTINL